MGTERDRADLAFVHLSDIHFRHGGLGDCHDEDKMLRHELQFDMRRTKAVGAPYYTDGDFLT